MPMIQQKDREQIMKMFSGRMKNPVTLINFTQEFECDYCRETRELAEELATLSDKITVKSYDFVRNEDKAKEFGVDKIPATVILGERDYHAKYYGIPAGYEFTS